MRALLLCLSMLALSACGPSAQELSAPPARLLSLIAKAEPQGFRTKNRQGKEGGPRPGDPEAHWLFSAPNAPARPLAIWYLALSDAEYSEVVEIEEWRYPSERDAEEALAALSSQELQRMPVFKSLNTSFAEGDRVYFVLSRALMFEPQYQEILRLLSTPR